MNGYCNQNPACTGLPYSSDCNDGNLYFGQIPCPHDKGHESHYHASPYCSSPPAAEGGAPPGPGGLRGIYLENGQEIVLRVPDIKPGQQMFVDYVEAGGPSIIRLDPGRGILPQIVNIDHGQDQWRFIIGNLSTTATGFTVTLQSKGKAGANYLGVAGDGSIVAEFNADGAAVFNAQVVSDIGITLQAPSGNPVYAQLGNDGYYYLSADGGSTEGETFWIYIEHIPTGAKFSSPRGGG